MKCDERNSLKRTGIFQEGGLAEAPHSLPNGKFWDAYKGLVALDESGRLYFTVRGRTIYTPLFNKLGISPEDVRTVGDFERAILQTLRLHDSTEASRLQDLLVSETASESQKRIIRRLLGIDSPKSANVLSFASVRSTKTGTL